MRYLMFVCVDPSGEPFDPAQDNVEEWVSTNDKNGTRIMGNRLEHVRRAKTVRVRKGQLLVTDGPFAETREWIGVLEPLLHRVAEPRNVVTGVVADRRDRELGHAGLGVDFRLRQAFVRRAGDRILREQPIVDRVFRRLAAR